MGSRLSSIQSGFTKRYSPEERGRSCHGKGSGEPCRFCSVLRCSLNVASGFHVLIVSLSKMASGARWLCTQTLCHCGLLSRPQDLFCTSSVLRIVLTFLKDCKKTLTPTYKIYLLQPLAGGCSSLLVYVMGIDYHQVSLCLVRKCKGRKCFQLSGLGWTGPTLDKRGNIALLNLLQWNIFIISIGILVEYFLSLSTL